MGGHILPVRRDGARGFAKLLLVALCLAGLARVSIGAIVPIKAIAAQILLERAFDRSLAFHSPQKPWPWADMAPIARIHVPRLGIDRIVLDTGSGQAMAFGPALLPGAARIGAPGTTVIAAHRDTHFRFLHYLRPGDVIEVETLDGINRRYRITNASVMRWNQFAVPSSSGENQLALSTCYPFDAIRHGPLRFVVWAVPIEAQHPGERIPN
jgi:sortase A